jgi:hypothetical protein
MGCNKLVAYLLFCSHQLLADSYWSHMPAFNSVQLTELSTEQHMVLSKHLDLSTAQTKLWLDQLPQLLGLLSCDTLEVLSQPLPDYIDPGYQVISYAGALKLQPDSKEKKTIWWLPWELLPSLSQLTTELSNLSADVPQPLLITEQQLKHKGQFVIVSGSNMSTSSPAYFALQLNILDQPELLWSVSSADAGFEELTGTMAQPVVMAEQEKLSLFLLNTGTTSAQKPLLYKVEALTGVVLARLVSEHTMSDLSGALTLYDHNRDSVQDSLIFGSKAGQLWQAQFEGNQFYNIQQLADLSGLKFDDIQFIRTLYAAVPVGGSGSDFHSRRSQWLVLLSVLQQQRSTLVTLKLQDGTVSVASDLVNRTLPLSPGLAVLTDRDVQQIQQKKGWYSQLPGRLTHMPLIAAGVVYLNLLNQDPQSQCSMEDASSALMALHLHHASSVYRHPFIPLDKAAGAMAVKTKAEGGFALIEQHSQRILIEELQEISPECAQCSHVMKQNSFPRWQLMGTYHSEEGAYE